ncbi:alpha/beta fold hydrolase [Salinarimonas ramus]|uniref:Alpha/beta hydrolase n=1 Tax=Salinarimonas ramus TaxID=690164 RepID=A0A917V411_9HYPH|nr:alpha/beta hydrolase [Salinarimonas ramus]GGK33831.1 alpha/beta hydrolase [Salinarimonas ramus]
MATFPSELPTPHRFVHEGRSVAWGSAGEDGIGASPLVLVHGTPFSCQVWRRIAPWLASNRKVYWFDLLGYGSSAMTPGADVSLGVQNGVLAALVREWGLTADLEVLAHDFGGATVLRAMLLDGLPVSKLTLVDPVAIAPWGSPFVQHVRVHEPAFAGLPDYAHEAMLRAYIAGAAHRPLSAEALDVHARPWLGAAGKPAFYAQIAQMDQRYTDEIEPMLGRLDLPVTLLWGEADAWIPFSQGERLAGMIPGARLVPVPGAGHLVQEDAPEAILAAMLYTA